MNTKNNTEYTINRYADGSVCYENKNHSLWTLKKYLIDSKTNPEKTFYLVIYRQKEYKTNDTSEPFVKIKDSITTAFNKNQICHVYDDILDDILNSQFAKTNYEYIPENYPIAVHTIAEYNDVPRNTAVYTGVPFPRTHMCAGLINESFLELTNRQMNKFPEFDKGEYSFINDINHFNTIAECKGEAYVTTTASFLKQKQNFTIQNFTTLRKEIYIKDGKIEDYYKFQKTVGFEDVCVISELCHKYGKVISDILDKCNLPDSNRPVIYKITLDYFDDKYHPYKNIYSESRRESRFYKKNARHISISIGYYDKDNISRKYIGDSGRYYAVNKTLLDIHLIRSGRNNKVEIEESHNFYEAYKKRNNETLTNTDDTISKSVEFREAFYDISEKLGGILNELNTLKEYSAFIKATQIANEVAKEREDHMDAIAKIHKAVTSADDSIAKETESSNTNKEYADAIAEAQSSQEYIPAFIKVSNKLVDMSVDVNNLAEYIAFVDALRIACETNEMNLNAIIDGDKKAKETP